MTLNEYQALANPNSHFKYPDALVYCVLALCGEAGELANKLKKSMRAGSERDHALLMDELGDVLWYVQETAGRLGYGLEEVAQFNLNKLAARRSKAITG